MSFTILKTFLTKSNLGMLNEIELRFNYSYSNLNAGNSIFVCKSAKKVNSGWCVVYCGSEPLAACHLSQWAGGGVGGTSAVIQWCDQVEVVPSTTCYRQINCGRQWAWLVEWHVGTPGLVANNATLGDGVPAKQHGNCLWSLKSYIHCVSIKSSPFYFAQ